MKNLGIYRILKRDNVVAGQWYFGTKCSACGETIHLFDDQSKGQIELPVAFEGKISTACSSCGHDDQYSSATLKASKASKDVPGSRPPRAKVSKAPRQPLWKAYPKARATFGAGYIEDRPKAAAVVARIVTSWADIEIQCARLLATMLGTNERPIAAAFATLRSSRTQHEVLSAVAKEVLKEPDFDLFAAYMARRAQLEGERNDLAHGSFGVSLAIPDGVVWAPQADFITFYARMSAGDGEQAADEFRKCQHVYELGTLERIAQEIEEFHGQLGSLIGYVNALRDGSADAATFCLARYPQLCAQSHIAEALAQRRAGKKPTQAPQQPPPAAPTTRRGRRRERGAKKAK